MTAADEPTVRSLMNSTELQQAIERNIEATSQSITEAWITLRLLEGLNSAARIGVLGEGYRARCANEFYRTAFTSIYVQIGTILDRGSNTLSLPSLLRRVRAAWAKDGNLLGLIDEVEADLEKAVVLPKLKSWRDKVIAHCTAKAHDPVFYVDNRVILNEVEEVLELFEELLNRVSATATGINYSLSMAIPGLERDVEKLFGVKADNS